MHRLLIAVTSLVVEHGLQGVQASVAAAPRLWSTGSVVVAHGFSCSAARGVLLDQGLNLCLLHSPQDSPPLSHQGSLIIYYFATLHSMHDLCSLTRDQTHAPYIGNAES